MPEEWCNAMICSICKKGDKLQCNNYTWILLLNVCHKVLTNNHQRWLVPYAEEILADYLCCLRKEDYLGQDAFLKNVMN